MTKFSVGYAKIDNDIKDRKYQIMITNANYLLSVNARDRL